MADDRKEMKVNIGGVEHTMLLDAEDAKRLDTEAKSRTASNKAGTASNKKG